MKALKQSLLMIVFFLVLSSAYAGLVLGFGAAFFPVRAGGSLVRTNGAIRGSILLGQDFARVDRFHGRPSAAGYDPSAGSASNLGPTSAALAKAIAERRAALLAENGSAAGEPPAELLLASGSGLDPDVSPAGAMYQVPRVARALGGGAAMEAELRGLVDESTRGRFLGLFGEERVNVLALNLELERLHGE